MKITIIRGLCPTGLTGRASAVLCAVALFALATANVCRADGVQSGWLGTLTHNNQPNGDVYAMAEFEGDLVIGGAFTSIGGVAANHIASWDGAAWHAMGGGLNGAVRALTVWNNVVVAGGDFSIGSDFTFGHVAHWDGSAWAGYAGGPADSVRALAVYQGALYAGANDLAAHTGYLWRWNGQWTQVASFTAATGAVNSLAAYTTTDSIPTVALAIGGDFNDVHPFGFPTLNATGPLVSYDGVTIRGVVQCKIEVGGAVHALASSASIDPLFVGGELLTSDINQCLNEGDFGSRYAWRLSGGFFYGEWETFWRGFVGDALNGVDGTIRTILGQDGSDAPILAGDFTHIYPDDHAPALAGHVVSCSRIVTPEGTGGWSLSPLGAGVDGPVYSAIRYGCSLIVGGSFTHAGSVAAGHLAAWDGQTWSAFGAGVNCCSHSPNVCVAFASSLVKVGDGSTWPKGILLGGAFLEAGTRLMNGVAEWRGAAWAALGSGLGGDAATGFEARALLSVTTGTSPVTTVYAGGDFTTAGGAAAHSLATWDGRVWREVGGGLNGPVSALAWWNGQVVVGGEFSLAGTVPAQNLALWDGSAWHAVSSPGSANGTDGPVKALAVMNGQLYVGGKFQHAGGVAACGFAWWTGAAWQVPAACLTDAFGAPGEVDALAALAPLPGIFVGGNFATAGGVPVNNVAQWGGTAWSALGAPGVGGVSGTNGAVYALASYGTQLAVGGAFTTAGGGTAQGLATFDPTAATWQALGGGVADGPVRALTADGTTLYVAGDFDAVVNSDGSLTSAPHFAAWGDTAGTTTAIVPAPAPRAAALEFAPPQPNPAAGAVTLAYMLPSAGMVTLAVYDARGALVARPVAQWEGRGPHSIVWDSRNLAGLRLPAGVYEARLTTPGARRTQRITLMR